MILTVVQKNKKDNASARSRTRVNYLEGSYAHHFLVRLVIQIATGDVH